MCYSDFNNIIKTIERMDADVISIETSRSGNELLNVFKRIGYKQEIGPGVYDIHSPRIPSVDEMVEQIELLLEVLPAEQLWINPDCGLKTRNWDEVEPSLQNMVEAVKIVRENLENQIEEENSVEEESEEDNSKEETNSASIEKVENNSKEEKTQE